MERAGLIARMGHIINAYKILARKPEGKRSLGRYRHRWEDNIRLDTREMRWEDVDRIHLAHVRDQWQILVNTVMNIQVP